MDEIRGSYDVPTVKTYALTEGHRIALEFMRRQHAVANNGFIVAIKYLRSEFDLGLKDAKDFADVIFERS